MAESFRPKGGRQPVPPQQQQPVTPTTPGSSLPPPDPEDAQAHACPEEDTQTQSSPRPAPRRRGKRYVPADRDRRAAFIPEQRLLILDAWQRSCLPARDFAPLVGLSRHTLYAWKQRFEQQGPAGLLDQPLGGPVGSKLSDLTK